MSKKMEALTTAVQAAQAGDTGETVEDRRMTNDELSQLPL